MIPMIPLTKVATVSLSAVAVGNLCFVSLPVGPLLALRIQIPQAPEAGAAIIFEASQPPTFAAFEHDNPSCLDLGVKPAIRVSSLPAEFSADNAAVRPGNLAIQGKSVCIVAQIETQARGVSPQMYVELSTGIKVAANGDRWLARSWQIGFEDGQQFHKLYEWPPTQNAEAHHG
jgi:hypothetical protein